MVADKLAAFNRLGLTVENLRLPALAEFLSQQRIDIQQLRRVLQDVNEKRNRAVHGSEPSMREEASVIRRGWLGQTADFPNIFAVLMPGAPQDRIGGV